eukprot:10821424-Alexandrium_andersonii.AAC.1
MGRKRKGGDGDGDAGSAATVVAKQPRTAAKPALAKTSEETLAAPAAKRAMAKAKSNAAAVLEMKSLKAAFEKAPPWVRSAARASIKTLES